VELTDSFVKMTTPVVTIWTRDREQRTRHDKTEQLKQSKKCYILCLPIFTKFCVEFDVSGVITCATFQNDFILVCNLTLGRIFNFLVVFHGSYSIAVQRCL